MTDPLFQPQPVAWPGAVNAWQVRPGLWRMARREWLTEAGWAELEHCGVNTVIDVRTPPEVGRRATDPPASTPGHRVEVVNLPVEDAEHPEFWQRYEPYPNHPQYYQHTVETFPHLVARALNTTWEGWRSEGVVVHCSAGRDRTGLIVAMLLNREDAPGGRATWAEQVAHYVAGVQGINEYRRTATVPHPVERYIPPHEFNAHVEERLDALREFLQYWTPERVHHLMHSPSDVLDHRIS